MSSTGKSLPAGGRSASTFRGVLFTGTLYVMLVSTFLLAIPILWHQKATKWLVLTSAKFSIPLFLWAGGVELITNGKENLDAIGDGPYVLVSNHSSFIDPLVIIRAIRGFDLAFLIKKEIQRRPFLGRLLVSFGYMVVDRESPVALKRFQEQVKKRVKGGWVARLGLFPEGTRSVDGKLQKFHIGPFLIAAQLGIPILPVVIRGAFTFQPPKRIAVCPGPVTVDIHAPIAPPEGKRNPAQMFEDAMELQRQTEEIFNTVSDFTIIEGEPSRVAA